MAGTAVIYQSRYGSTARYAHWIADKTDAALIKLADFGRKDLLRYGTVVFGSPIFAGTLGCARFLRTHAEELASRRVGLFVVGLGPLEGDDREAVCRTAIPSRLRDSVSTFQLRGAINYSRLSMLHRGIMKLVDRRTLRRAHRDPTSINRERAAQVGKDMNFVEPSLIEPIVTWATRTVA